MSADLFAEFSNPSNPSQQPPQAPASSTLSHGQNQQDMGWFQPNSMTQQSSQQKQQQQQQQQPTQKWSAPQPQNDALLDWGQPDVVQQPTQQPWSTSQTQQSGNFSNWGGPSMTPQPTEQADDDGWGDFEVAQTKDTAVKFPPLESQGGGSQARITEGQPPNTRMVRASTMELITNSLVDVEGPSQMNFEERSRGIRLSQSKAMPPMRTKRNDPNVLFDVADFELGENDIKEEDEDDSDDFGDFESSTPSQAPPKPTTVKQATGQMSSSMDLLSLDESQPAPAPVSSPAPAPARAKPQKQPPERLQNVLSFAATSQDSAQQTSSTRSPYLQSPKSSYPMAPKSPSFQERNPFPELAIKTPTPTPTDSKHKSSVEEETPVTAWPSFDNDEKAAVQKDDDDGWGAWEDDEGASVAKKTGMDDTKPPESWDWDAVDNVKPTTTMRKTAHDAAPPPMNVPPPSIILSVFPDLFNAGAAFFKPMSKQSASIKQQVLADPRAGDFLLGYLLLATTAARVIAGRKHRWHRDKILAKSMSISAAGSKGMKLAGVDKAQSAREDREAADVVAAWRDNVGRLRSAVAAANAAGKANLRVPELGESLQIQTAKMVPTAPKPCVICGLKREERIARVDYDVEDSFGEWWVEHWGHRACKNFWVEHEAKLRQR